ncbi:MAG: SHOCT domain-containing protein [Coriobacteriia bacterium]|nr:SHOCT domain-containing protein [Coriobacteriia bacterium]
MKGGALVTGRYVAGMDIDSTPVFYSSKQLKVTGMKISSGSRVYPVSTITTVEILGRRTVLIVESLKMAGAGVMLLFMGLLLSGLMGGSGACVFGPLLLASVLAFLASVLCIFVFIFEREVHICPSSGNSLIVKVYDLTTALEMRAAVERAMTYHANSAAGVPTVADELNKLAALRSQGAISESDWERAKDLFLGKRPSAQEQAIEQLRQLYELHRSGVLSESEFNMKKWDILSRNQSQAAF